MRDPVIEEALRRLAAEAATRFSALLASGEEIPFDVTEEDGEHTFYRYQPLTARFIEGHAGELRSLPSFGPACGAVSSADVAGPFLEARGQTVPALADERAAKALILFISSLWDGCAEFTLEGGRLERALRELETAAADPSDAELLIAPLVGFQMPTTRLQLPSGLRIIRADLIEAPPEAMSSEGMQRSSWQPQYVALAEQPRDHEGAGAPLRQLRELITVLRLFKAGSVALGPHAFARVSEGGWRRISTGAPGTRPGGYKLSGAETGALAELAGALEARPDPSGALAFSIARFELGCERSSALSGLSDHLLALRALLDGDGPIGATLSMRVAGLIAQPGEREAAAERIRSAFQLEPRLMRGLDAKESAAAIALATWLEDALRTILKGAALGELGGDLRMAAEESLIAAGLRAGEGSAQLLGEWEVIGEESEAVGGEAAREDPETSELDLPEGEGIRAYRVSDVEGSDGKRLYAEEDPGYEEGYRVVELGEREHEHEGGSPDPEDFEHHDAPDEELVAEAPIDSQEGYMESEHTEDWLDEVSRETLEFPTAARARSDAQRVDTPRVRHLFPIPDDADWEISELHYSREKAPVSR